MRLQQPGMPPAAASTASGVTPFGATPASAVPAAQVGSTASAAANTQAAGAALVAGAGGFADVSLAPDASRSLDARVPVSGESLGGMQSLPEHALELNANLGDPVGQVLASNGQETWGSMAVRDPHHTLELKDDLGDPVGQVLASKDQETWGGMAVGPDQIVIHGEPIRAQQL